MHYCQTLKGARYRKDGWTERSRLLLQLLLSEWALTKKTSGLSFIILCPKVWKAMHRSVDELVAMAKMLNVFFIILTLIGKNTIGLFATMITPILPENNKTWKHFIQYLIFVKIILNVEENNNYNIWARILIRKIAIKNVIIVKQLLILKSSILVKLLLICFKL